MNTDQPYNTIQLPPCPLCGGALTLAQGRGTGKYFALHKMPPAPYHHFDMAPTVDAAIAAIDHPHTVDVTGIVPAQQKEKPVRTKRAGKSKKKEI